MILLDKFLFLTTSLNFDLALQISIIHYTGCLVLLAPPLHHPNQKGYRAHQKLILKLISIQIDLTWSWVDTDKNLWVN